MPTNKKERRKFKSNNSRNTSKYIFKLKNKYIYTYIDLSRFSQTIKPSENEVS